MRPMPFTLPAPLAQVSFSALLAFALAVAVLPGCGGVDSGGTGQTVEKSTTSSGPITGFGSVIVNGVRYDDSAATVVDEDGATRSVSDLRLGMVVEVQGRVRGNTREGTASRIEFGEAISGPVESVDAAASRLTVLGQVVEVDAGTLFEGFGGALGSVQPGQLAEVHGLYDSSSGIYGATRIELKPALDRYTLRGPISNLATPPASTFSIGGAAIDYGAASTTPGLHDGLMVRVNLQTVPVSGRWVASSVRSVQRNIPDGNDAKLEGRVAALVSRADFRVDGVPVDASAPGLVVRNGSIDDLANGARVEVEGVMRAGVLVAEVLDFQRSDNRPTELTGRVQSVDAGAQTFVLRNVTVTWDANTIFERGLPADLPGRRVAVTGTAAGASVLAQRITFED